MKKEIITFLAIILFSLTCNCTFARGKILLSQNPQREVETQIIETSDTEKVLLSVATTLQDSDFIIQEFEPELGYIRAQKIFKKKHLNKKRIAGESLKLAAFSTYAVFTYGSTAYYVADPTRRLSNEFHNKTFVVDTNITIEPTTDNKTKVRFAFVQKVLQNADGYSFVKSAPTKVLRTYEPEIYQEFFMQLNKNIFYEET
jgi:hypothetical protein